MESSPLLRSERAPNGTQERCRQEWYITSVIEDENITVGTRVTFRCFNWEASKTGRVTHWSIINGRYVKLWIDDVEYRTRTMSQLSVAD